MEQKGKISPDDPSAKELNAFVQNLLGNMQNRFEEMSKNIVGRIDEMGKRIDDIQKSIQDVLNDLGQEDNQIQGKK